MPIIDIDVRYNLAKRLRFRVSIRQLVPRRPPASLEAVSMKVSGD
jgi:hypothetical protein